MEESGKESKSDRPPAMPLRGNNVKSSTRRSSSPSSSRSQRTCSDSSASSDSAFNSVRVKHLISTTILPKLSEADLDILRSRIAFEGKESNINLVDVLCNVVLEASGTAKEGERPYDQSEIASHANLALKEAYETSLFSEEMFRKQDDTLVSSDSEHTFVDTDEVLSTTSSKPSSSSSHDDDTKGSISTTSEKSFRLVTEPPKKKHFANDPDLHSTCTFGENATFATFPSEGSKSENSPESHKESHISDDEILAYDREEDNSDSHNCSLYSDTERTFATFPRQGFDMNNGLMPASKALVNESEVDSLSSGKAFYNPMDRWASAPAAVTTKGAVNAATRRDLDTSDSSDHNTFVSNFNANNSRYGDDNTFATFPARESQKSSTSNLPLGELSDHGTFAGGNTFVSESNHTHLVSKCEETFVEQKDAGKTTGGKKGAVIILKNICIRNEDPPKAPMDIWHPEFWTDDQGGESSKDAFSNSDKTPSEKSVSIDEVVHSNVDDNDLDDHSQSSEISDISGLTGVFTEKAPDKQKNNNDSKRAERSRSALPKVSGETLSSTKSKRESRVKFADVTVREYSRILSDNPACTKGAAVGLGWEYNIKDPVSVDAYEFAKKPPRPVSELILDRRQREEIFRQWGFTDHELAAVVRELNRLRSKRRQTVNNLGARKVEEAIETAAVKMKRLLFLKANEIKTSY